MEFTEYTPLEYQMQRGRDGEDCQRRPVTKPTAVLLDKLRHECSAEDVVTHRHCALRPTVGGFKALSTSALAAGGQFSVPSCSASRETRASYLGNLGFDLLSTAGQHIQPLQADAGTAT